jgi:hypothetical protein
LDARKTIFHQNADIPNLARYFVCEDGDDDGNDGASVFGGEGDADSKSIEEIVNEGRE